MDKSHNLMSHQKQQHYSRRTDKLIRTFFVTCDWFSVVKFAEIWSHLHIWMRCAVVATAVVASVLVLLLCPGVVVTGEATDNTRALVCSSSSLACSTAPSSARPLHITAVPHIRVQTCQAGVRGSGDGGHCQRITRMVTTRENHLCIS